MYCRTRYYNIYIGTYTRKRRISFEKYILILAFLVSKILSDLSNGLFSSDDNSVLCEIDTGNILNINMSAKELKLKNGSKLMLL